jgi:dihydrofolate reductase
VITRDPFFSAEGVLIAHSVEEALGMAFDNEETEAFIIGGGQIYRDSMELWDKLYLTTVETAPEGDVHFPEINPDEWNETWCEKRPADEKNEFDCTFRILARKETEN